MPALHSKHTFSEWSNAFVLGLSEVHHDKVKRLGKDYTTWLREKRADHFYDTEWKVSGLGIMPEKQIGEAISVDKMYNGPTKQFGMQPYALGVVIQYEALRWDLYHVFDDLMGALAKSAIDRYNLVAYSVLTNSFSTSDTTYQTYQGEVLFTDTHSRLDGGTWSNASTTGLSYLGFQEARTELKRTVDERGHFMADVNPRTIITSPEQEWIAETIVNSTGRPGTADNDINTLRGKGYKIVTSPYITNTTAWFLWDKDAVEISMRLGDDPFFTADYDIRSMDRVGTAYCSFALRVFDSKGAWGSTGGA